MCTSTSTTRAMQYLVLFSDSIMSHYSLEKRRGCGVLACAVIGWEIDQRKSSVTSDHCKCKQKGMGIPVIAASPMCMCMCAQSRILEMRKWLPCMATP
jgi:hypothetical protein